MVVSLPNTCMSMGVDGINWKDVVDTTTSFQFSDDQPHSFLVLQGTESWVGPGNEATSFPGAQNKIYYLCITACDALWSLHVLLWPLSSSNWFCGLGFVRFNFARSTQTTYLLFGLITERRDNLHATGKRLTWYSLYSDNWHDSTLRDGYNVAKLSM